MALSPQSLADAAEPLRRQERDALEKQILRADAEQCRREYTVALRWLSSLNGLSVDECNHRIAGILAEGGDPGSQDFRP
jgi:hypothetical protein